MPFIITSYSNGETRQRWGHLYGMCTRYDCSQIFLIDVRSLEQEHRCSWKDNLFGFITNSIVSLADQFAHHRQ